ncbi:MAG TPA: sialate O-acetylesterase [Luteolibacter sp.]|nr:sialate O-acetylesterase [Luteolibacter sp.]
MLKIPALLALLVLVQPLMAELIPAPLFQDGMVLQRDMPAPVWGRAKPGDKITASITANGPIAAQEKSTTADATGRWMLQLDPMPASAANGVAMHLKVNGRIERKIDPVLVGEVWLASGQSNMQWAISQSRKEDQEMAKSGEVPVLRSFDVPRVLSHTRKETVEGSWRQATPENAMSFSAVGYFFGRKLAEELQVPIGIIHSSWGGSRIEPWWAEEGLEGIPELDNIAKARIAKSPGFPEYDKQFRKYLDQLGEWTRVAAKAMDAGLPAPDMPPAPELLRLGHGAETGTYQAMIHPLGPSALRGFMWYPGESNNGAGLIYTAKMRALINGWRGQFDAPEAPFLFVQLAPFKYGGDRGNPEMLPGIWWAQQEALKIPHTGMAVTNDIGNIRDIHPRNKSAVGERLARWALADTYGRSDLVKSGPLFSGHETQGKGMLVRFDHIGGGLASRDGKPLSWFELAGTDGKYHPAQAEIADDGKSILLTSEAVPEPQRARFAWSHIAEPNLMNKEGLPAGAFLTHPEEIAAAGR